MRLKKQKIVIQMTFIGHIHVHQHVGITQVPEQMSSLHMDHEMDDDDDIDHDDEDHHTGTDNDQQQPESPTITNGSDELIELNHTMNDDDEHQQQSQPPSIITSTHQRKTNFTVSKSQTSTQYHHLRLLIHLQ